MMRWMKEIWKTSGDNLKRVKICPFVVNIIPWFWLAMTIFLYLVTVMNIGDTLDVGAEVWCGADTKPVSWQPARFTSHLSSLRLWLRWSPRVSSHLSESRLRLRNAYCLHLTAGFWVQTTFLRVSNLVFRSASGIPAAGCRASGLFYPDTG